MIDPAASATISTIGGNFAKTIPLLRSVSNLEIYRGLRSDVVPSCVLAACRCNLRERCSGHRQYPDGVVTEFRRYGFGQHQPSGAMVREQLGRW
jgi:hypothetical protein